MLSLWKLIITMIKNSMREKNPLRKKTLSVRDA